MDNLSLFFLIFNLAGKSQLLDLLMIFGAEYLIMLEIILIIYFASNGLKLERKAFFVTCLGLFVSFIVIFLIRLFYLEPRPFVSNNITPLIKLDPDATFPSVHTSIMATIAFSFTLVKSKLSLILILFMCWVGFARIFVGVHYPLDILGGIGVGLISSMIAKQLLEWFKIKFA